MKRITKEHTANNYQLNGIYLNNTSFIKGNLESGKTLLNINITRDCNQVSQNDLKIEVSVELTSKEFEEFNLTATMTGLFIIEGRPPLSIEEFYKYNAAAMIYANLREHIRWTSLQANISPAILLPIINFYALDENKSKNEESKP